jgi:hypothetical protein
MEDRYPCKGDRFTFSVAGVQRVAGTVRWVVEDRVGFAFDRPICEEALGMLSVLARQFRPIELYRA